MGSLIRASSSRLLPSFPSSPVARRRPGELPHVFASVRPSCGGARYSTGAIVMGKGRPANVCLDRSYFGCGDRVRRVRSPVVRASVGEPGKKSSVVVGGGANGRLFVAASITVGLAVVNRVLYKLALVPMKDYPFFMAQLTTFGYVIIYFSILYWRRHAGIVTDDMLAIPKPRFLAIGFLEALGLASGMAAAAMLPGPTIPILTQAFLVWQLAFSALLLGRKYSPSQVIGCLLVAGGVVTTVGSGTTDGQLLAQVGILWPSLMVLSTAFQAAASILKEFIFVDSSKRLQGKALDIFVVNSFGSGFQALFVLLLLPVLSQLKGIPFIELPEYFRNGAGCFLNVGLNTTGCDGSPLLPLLYISANMAFNISALYLLKISSALVSSLSTMLAVRAVPLSVFILTLPLPYITKGTDLDRYFVAGTVILTLGLLLYNLPQSSDSDSKSD